MSNAGSGEERAISSGGSAVVEDSAIVGQKIAVDVPIAGLVGALVGDAGITGGSEIASARHQIESPKQDPKKSAQRRLPQSDLPQ